MTGEDGSRIEATSVRFSDGFVPVFPTADAPKSQ